jgi:hypothetical protein
MKLIALSVVSFAFAIGLASCSTPSKSNVSTSPREPAAADSQPFLTGAEDFPAVELGEKWGPENNQQTDAIVNMFINMLKGEMKPGVTVRRDAHPKHHACLRAQFSIEPSALPADERVGLYSKSGLYNAWIRFSNANPAGNAKPDSELDQHGMAVKIIGVDGSPTGNHDLVMMDDERFFSKDGENYLPMTEALLGGGAALGKFLIMHPRQATVLLTSRHPSKSPLQSAYFSSTPYKLGSHSSRFTMQPCDVNNVYNSLPDSNSASPNYLRERLATVVQKQDTCFDFFVQPNNDPRRNDIEDATLVWSRNESPLVKVGRILIPVQSDMLSEKQMNFCENVSMDPWRAPSENRPMGQINRIRKLAYPRISAFRHKANDRARVEPRSHHPCDDAATADLCISTRQ